MKSVIYPGSFDPITLGHLDVICRAVNIFGSLTVAVLYNPRKKASFTPEERVEMIRRVTAGMPVTVLSSDKLLVDFAREIGCEVAVKGLRAISDFEHEFQMALTNRKMSPTLDTVYLNTSLEFLYLSSSLIKEVGRMGGDVAPFLPPEIADDVIRRIKEEA